MENKGDKAAQVVSCIATVGIMKQSGVLDAYEQFRGHLESEDAQFFFDAVMICGMIMMATVLQKAIQE